MQKKVGYSSGYQNISILQQFFWGNRMEKSIKWPLKEVWDDQETERDISTLNEDIKFCPSGNQPSQNQAYFLSA